MQGSLRKNKRPQPQAGVLDCTVLFCVVLMQRIKQVDWIMPELRDSPPIWTFSSIAKIMDLQKSTL